MLEIGTLLDGKYRILKVIGSGGMSLVYLAVNERANKYWAVKEIRRDASLKLEIVKKSLVRETDILKKMRHVCLPRIIDVIDGRNSILIVMDYIEGETMDKVLKRCGACSQHDVVRWAKQLCDVLSYLHSRKPPVIYLDMKPGNIMLKADGNVMLIDFGTAVEARSSGSGDAVCLGTRGYAAPEQYNSPARTDARTDIYCLGMTLYHLLTGHDPTCGSRDREFPGSPDPDSMISDGLEWIIHKCTRENPGDRYQDCSELLRDLNRYEKLDYRHRQRRAMQLRMYFLCCLITFVLAAGTLAAGGYYHILIRRNYLNYLEQAGRARDLSEMKESIHAAVLLDRGNPGAYQKMLSWISSDHLMTDEEKSALESILYENRSGWDNITLFRRHKRQYEDFSYNMGVACFFYYKGSRGKSIAKTWFDGLEHSSLSKDRRSRAGIYSRIGSYYSSLDHEDRSGETARADYSRFFKDLSALNAFRPEDIRNSRAAVTLYCEISCQLGTHAADFLSRGTGITAGMLKKEIGKISSYLWGGRLRGISYDDRRKLEKNLNDALLKIEAAGEQRDRISRDQLKGGGASVCRMVHCR